jgi:hypothetical protein
VAHHGDGVTDRLRIDGGDERHILVETSAENGKIMVGAELVGQQLQGALLLAQRYRVQDIEHLDLMAKVLGALPPVVQERVGGSRGGIVHRFPASLVHPLQSGGDGLEAMRERSFRIVCDQCPDPAPFLDTLDLLNDRRNVRCIAEHRVAFDLVPGE